jgi:hypothetical protein
MFYRLPEKRQDLNDVCKMMDAISVKCVPTSCVRLGRIVDGATSARPLKVIFKTAEDRDTVVRGSKNLKNNDSFGRVNVSCFLPREEMVKLKEMRGRCKGMNDSHADGSNPYIVINGQIMIKQLNGKLRELRTFSANAQHCNNGADTIHSDSGMNKDSKNV